MHLEDLDLNALKEKYKNDITELTEEANKRIEILELEIENKNSSIELLIQEHSDLKRENTHNYNISVKFLKELLSIIDSLAEFISPEEMEEDKSLFNSIEIEESWVDLFMEYDKVINFNKKYFRKILSKNIDKNKRSSPTSPTTKKKDPDSMSSHTTNSMNTTRIKSYYDECSRIREVRQPKSKH